MKQRSIVFLFWLASVIAANAQDSTANRIGLQHTVAAAAAFERFIGYGVNYDLRFRTPNKWTDWAVGSTVLYTPNYYIDHGDYMQTNFYGSMLLGSKNWAFEAGLEPSLTIRIQTDWLTKKYVGMGYSLDLATFLGARYQPPRSAFYAKFTMGYHLLYLYGVYNSVDGRRWEYPGIKFTPLLDRLCLSVGYTFPVKYKK
jgi:hypothetical protein